MRLWRKKHYYRISKYDPQFRKNGIYTKNEWTSVYDVGNIFDGTKLTKSEYLKVENNYLLAIEKIMDSTHTKSLTICKLEDYRNHCRYRDGQRLCQKKDILSVVRDCLREKYWCELRSHSLTIHFGYEYYVYVRCALSYSEIIEETSPVGLFVEKDRRPW